MLQRALDVGFCHDSWAWIDIEPAYDRLRALPRFKALVEQADRIAVEQRAELERMRAARLITYRTPPGAAQNPTTASP